VPARSEVRLLGDLSSVGSRPSCVQSVRSARFSFIRSTMCTGIRIVRLVGEARATAWRIHQVA
jgi:hypothetical protein